MKKIIRTLGILTFVALIGITGSQSAYAALENGTATSSPTGFITALNNFDPNINLNLEDGTISVDIPTPNGTTTTTTETDTFFFPDNIPIPSTICKLKVIKTVEGGTAQPSDFQIHVLRNGVDIDGSPRAGSASGTWYETSVAGQYSVNESGPAGYTAQYSGDCSSSGTIGLTLGTSAVCHIKNVFNGSTTTPPTPPATTTPPTATTTPSTGGGSLSGTVIAPPATTTAGGSLSGDVVAPWTLTGDVIAPPSGGGGSLGGTVVTPPGGGSLGGTVVTPPGGGSLGGTVVSPTTTTPGEAIAGTSDVLPGIPNTGADDSILTLVISALITIFGSIALTRMRRA